MGILNLTPDSFYDGGRYKQRDEVLARVEEMITQGMDILDIGGESTRPGFIPVTEEEEISRVIPFIEEIRKTFDVPISLDTSKSKVAEAGLQAGADMINDIWGLMQDPDMSSLVAKSGAACCLMHNRNQITPGGIHSIKVELQKMASLAIKAGVKKERIMLDPGIGFAKTQQQNLEIIKKLEEITDSGYPILLAASRKSVIGEALQLPAEERLEGAMVTTVIAVQKGCSFVRVHDVKEHVRAIQMTRAILNI
jgi:dihydropteroate synthase